MEVQEIMTSDPVCCSANDSIADAAGLMERNDCGLIPVVDSRKAQNSVVGVITDRDIAIRGVARGLSADATVEELMTPKPHCCSPHDDVKEVGKIMSDRQVRRVVVVDDDGHCVGIVAQADLARAAESSPAIDEIALARVVERISEEPSVGSSRSDDRSTRDF
jgi:CBS domain-containing protein